MAEKKKRLTQRQKAERAAIKKKLQGEGLIPPDKPRLNRKKFAREVTPEDVGVLKLLKLAVETDRFLKKLESEGRKEYKLGEYFSEVYDPVKKL